MDSLEWPHLNLWIFQRGEFLDNDVDELQRRALSVDITGVDFSARNLYRETGAKQVRELAENIPTSLDFYQATQCIRAFINKENPRTKCCKCSSTKHRKRRKYNISDHGEVPSLTRLDLVTIFSQIGQHVARLQEPVLDFPPQSRQGFRHSKLETKVIWLNSEELRTCKEAHFHHFRSRICLLRKDQGFAVHSFYSGRSFWEK